MIRIVKCIDANQNSTLKVGTLYAVDRADSEGFYIAELTNNTLLGYGLFRRFLELKGSINIIKILFGE